jgi:hypothetical protein
LGVAPSRRVQFDAQCPVLEELDESLTLRTRQAGQSIRW